MILSGKPYKPKSKFLWILGNHLKEERDKAGLSQEELAEKAGVSRGQLCDIENGKVNARIETLFKLSTSVGINFGVLIRAVIADYDLG